MRTLILGAALVISVALPEAKGKTMVLDIMTHDQAYAQAVKILRGIPYGRTITETGRHITEIRLLVSGTPSCGGQETSNEIIDANNATRRVVKTPIWEFHVIVSAGEYHDDNAIVDGKGGIDLPEHDIDGWLELDARTGKMTCASLPFLD